MDLIRPSNHKSCHAMMPSFKKSTNNDIVYNHCMLLHGCPMKQFSYANSILVPTSIVFMGRMEVVTTLLSQ